MAAKDVSVALDAAWQILLQAAASRAGASPMTGAIDPDSAGINEAARDLLDCLAPLVSRPGRMAVAQLGQSLDGRIATESGHSHYINGLESRIHLHRLRALMQAVVVGAGTACEDNPQLTVRHVTGPQPVRVILDPRGRVPASLQLFQDGAAPTLHLHGEDVEPAGPVGGHVNRQALPVQDGGFAPAAVLDALAQRGLERVLIEGGGITVSRFLEAGVLDRLHLMVAPLLIGSGRPGLVMTPITTLGEALRPVARTFRCGDDTLFDLDVSRALAS